MHGAAAAATGILQLRPAKLRSLIVRYSPWGPAGRIETIPNEASATKGQPRWDNDGGGALGGFLILNT